MRVLYQREIPSWSLTAFLEPAPYTYYRHKQNIETNPDGTKAETDDIYYP